MLKGIRVSIRQTYALIIVICSFLSSRLHGQIFSQDPQHLTVEEGLSNNWVRSIIKDSQGYMWFGTFNGLNRYDGKNFKVYRVNTGNDLSDNFIESLAEDHLGNIWVGTFSGGLNLFNRKTEKFRTFQNDPTDPSSISGNKIYSIFSDRDKNLWIGTDAGLDLFDYQNNNFRHFQHDAKNSKSITEGFVSTIFQDHSGKLWIGTSKGLNILNLKTNEFTSFFAGNSNKGLTHNYVKSLYEDKYGNIWIGTWGGGLNLFDKETETFEHFEANIHNNKALNNNAIIWLTGDHEGHIYIGTEGGGLNVLDTRTREFSHYGPDLNNPNGLKSNSIHTLYYDHDSGILWIGSYNGGVSYFCKWSKPFVHYQARKNGLSDNHITCISEDNDGNLWVGTDGGGVNYINVKTNTYKYYQHEENNSGSLLSGAVLSILCDTKNNVWIGTFNGGLDLIDRKSNQLKHFRHNPQDPTSLGGEHVSAVYEDKRGNIWVGTFNGGLHLFNKNATFTRFQHNPADETSILDNFIIGIYEDSQSGLLIQTGKGLEVFDYKTKSFERFNKSLAVNFDVPNTVLEDRLGNLWIGSQEMGLFKITRPGNKLTTYTDKDGLPSNGISGILEDNNGNLWVSTLKGLCRFDNAVNHTSNEKPNFHVYSAEDGLQGTEFKQGAYCKLKNGSLAFGGQNGFNVFDPVSIKDNPFIAPVKITGFKVFNKDVPFGENEILPSPIDEVDHITLSHRESVFSLEFSALSFMLSEKNKYSYMLKGLEKNWNNVGTQSIATYTNLDPGEYEFLVKASNNDNVWNEAGASLKITVLPPWWSSSWFLAFIAIVVVGAAISYYKYRTYHLKQSKKELEQQVSIRTAALKEANSIIAERHEEIQIQNESLVQKNLELEKQTHEISRMTEEIKALNEVKLRFFTNISHELRTPLNLIIWPLEEMLKNKLSESESREKYELMHKNASRLIKLINQLLDFQKIETGTLQLRLEQKNIILSLQDVFDSFKDWAQRYHIHFVLESNTDHINMWYDEDKLEKILSNLLSNAFKNVEEHGEIGVYVQLLNEQGKKGAQLIIEVRDNGKGIPPDQIGLIFNRFYEGASSKIPGTGIGLALVKELVELHRGEVSVHSKVNEGTTFTVKLPTGLTALENQIRDQNMKLDEKFEELSDVQIMAGGAIRENIPVLLIVEDNDDIRNYVSKKLVDDYNIEQAHNGREGFEKAVEIVPDLIISDVMMPEMDGFELCKQLKTDERTSHIPVILVTARSGEESQLQGLAIGADDYITKPYNFSVLQLKVKNVLYTREKFKEQFLKNPHLIPENSSIQSPDEAFLKKAVSIIEENLDNSEFGVEDFSEYFKMSRRNVLRKIKGMTGLSINEFIKTIRLKESHKLLTEGRLNVAEVAYSVGFSDQKYFSKCFKEHFGITPSEVISK